MALTAAHQRARVRVSGIIFVITAMACFSLSDVMAKRLTASLPLVEVVWFRYLALAATIIWLIARRQPLRAAARPSLQGSRALCVVASTVLFNAGLMYLPLAAATALVFSSPLFVTLLSVLVLRERVLKRQWAYVLLGFAGVVLVAQPDPASFNPAVLFPIASSMAWAGALILTRLVAPTDSAFTTQAYSCGIGVTVLTALLPIGFEMPSAIQAVELAAMAACWTSAQWLIVHAYSRTEASTVAPFAYSQLVWANLLGFFLLGHVPEITTIIGSVVIALAGLGALHATSRAARSRIHGTDT